MASGFHNPYAGSSIDAHLLGMQQTEEQAAQRRQQAGQNQQAMGLAQQQMAADQAQTQQAMGMQQQRMAHEYGMQQQAFGQAMQMSQMEAQQRTMRDKLMLDAQRKLSQEAQQFQLRLEALNLEAEQARVSGDIETLRATEAEAMALNEKKAERAAQLSILEIAQEQTGKNVGSLMQSLKSQINGTTSIAKSAQERVVNSSPAILTAIQERQLNRSRTAATNLGAGVNIDYGLTDMGAQYVLSPNLLTELGGVPGSQYLERADQTPTGLRLAGAALNPFETRAGLYFRGPMSAEKLRDTVKQEMIEDVRESVNQLGAKVKDDAALTSGFSMMLEGDGAGGIKKLIDSGVDPLTIRYLVKVINESASDSTNSLQTQMNEAMARDPSSPQAQALQAAVSANAIRNELFRKAKSILESQTTGVEELNAMERRVEQAIIARNYNALLEESGRVPTERLVQAMREQEVAEFDVLQAGKQGSELELEDQRLKSRIGLDLAESRLRALDVQRAGLEGLLGGTR